MPPTVDLYGTAYGNFAEDVLTQVRRDTYGEDFGQSSWVTGIEYRRFFQLLKLAAADHVLDVGCGSGGPALFLAREAGCRVTGVDVNQAGIQAGLTLARQAGLEDRVHFRRADVREPLPFPDRSFDAIVCMDAMCHLPDRGRILGEWCRVLRPGGRMLYTDPVVMTGLVTNEELATRSSTGYFEFCPPGVNERLIGQAGFELVRAEDVTDNEVEVSHRWHAARQLCSAELIRLEGEETFAGLQRFLATVHRLTSDRRLSRFAYLGRKPE
ncbi:SAM-dependent methyltransferase [Aquisphaera insulae]|uniref:SAM-dependent methyltransferase n=1 Tax=Aquisphaera insulae TaxID=2712864 RepID=UPI0013EC85ED|nr:class I SAM-dependent methyltransferase [Aquisphaera insulae]